MNPKPALHRTLLTLMLALLLAFTSACSGGGAKPADSSKSGAAPAASGKKLLNIGITGTPMDLNAIDPGDTASELLLHLLFVPLTELQQDMTFKPMLAKEVTTKDNKVFTIKLQDNAKWTDGKPVTVDDVIFSLEMITDPEGATMTGPNFTQVVGINDKGRREGATIPGVKKVDDKTMEVTLKAAQSMNLFQSSFCRFLVTVPKHVYSGIKAADFGKDPKVQNPTVTDGPYKLAEFKRDQHVQFTANPDYMFGKPIVETLVFKVVTPANLTVQLQDGELDMSFPQLNSIPVEDADKVKAASNLEVVAGDPTVTLFFFTNNKLFTNPKTRQAMSMAIDRDLIFTKLLKGYGEAADTFFTTKNPYFDATQAKTPFDPAKAKALLAESGWDMNKEVVLTSGTTNKSREQATNVVMANLKAIGMKVSIQKVDHATAMGKAKKGEYDMIIMGDNLIPIDPTYDMPFFLTEGNWNRYESAKMNDLFKSVRSETDDAKLKTTLAEVQKLMRADTPLIVLGSISNVGAKNKRVTVGGPKDFGTLSDVEKWDVSR